MVFNPDITENNVNLDESRILIQALTEIILNINKLLMNYQSMWMVPISRKNN
jgi:hypothetical protein